MKFAKGLEENIVPEWRVKYIDYKGGKKRIKDVAKVIKYAEASPAVNSLYIYTLLNQPAADPNSLRSKTKGKGGLKARFKWVPSLFSAGPTYPMPTVAEPPPTQDPTGGVDTPLAGAARQLRSLSIDDAPSTTQYGTISSPSDRVSGVPIPPPSLQLPEPMQPPYLNNDEPEARSGKIRHIPGGPDISITKRKIFPFHRNKGLTSFTMANSRPVSLKHVASSGREPGATMPGKVDGIQEEAIEDFFRWLEAELRKIDTFYRMKEEEAARRLEELREQLHIMRDIRIAEIREATRAHSSDSGGQKSNGGRNLQNPKISHSLDPIEASRVSIIHGPSPSDRRRAPTLQQINPATQLHPDLREHLPASFTSNRNSYQSHANEQGFFFRQLTASQRDYTVHRKPVNEITYRVAKRKLKAAMIEYYRGLELLKSYCHQNQEGLRKIIKKFDKATGLRTSKKFTYEKISKSYFGSSDILEALFHQTEDLFSRYFESGDRKHAVERLRTKEKSREFYGSTFRSGILLGLGAFAITQGIVKGWHASLTPETSEQSLYLLQVWAGFFLALLSMLLFALNCRTWVKNKINYIFCFEFDTRHNLDYHQLTELPALLWFLMCVIFWLNFENFWPNRIDPIQYPIIFLALSSAIIFSPVPILYYRSRRWFLYAHWRLLLSGIYPVEFRDFWLGDMYCSLTYTMGNIALTACLYNGNWGKPGNCNSSHSQLLGFFSCLPGIWRLLQCLRRYGDTRNAFPHLANAGKYACTILYYVSLSLWRINETEPEKAKALFLAFGTINAIYCATWDIAMDWSLLNPYAAWPFLRQEIAFKRPIIYYIAMLADSFLRFNWIFYVFFGSGFQVSFLISLSEVVRRWIWAFFRMENEHCTNVGNFRAYREIPLPYELLPPSQARMEEASHIPRSASLTQCTVSPGAEFSTPTAVPTASGHHSSISAATLTANSTPPQQAAPITTREQPDLERQPTSIPGVRYRGRPSSIIQCRESEVGTPTMRALSAVGSALSRAHTQDFERRRSRPESGRINTDYDEEDDDDDDSSHTSEDEGRMAEDLPRARLSTMSDFSVRSRAGY